jgi:hypothetical protein
VVRVDEEKMMMACGSLYETRTRLARFAKNGGSRASGAGGFHGSGGFHRRTLARGSCRRTPACVALIPRLGRVAAVFTVVAANADHLVHQSPAPVSLEMQEQVARVRYVVADRQVDRQTD